jgi:hypothetical protein
MLPVVFPSIVSLLQRLIIHSPKTGQTQLEDRIVPALGKPMNPSSSRIVDLLMNQY